MARVFFFSVFLSIFRASSISLIFGLFLAFYLMPAGETTRLGWLDASCTHVFVEFSLFNPPASTQKSFCALSLFSVPCFNCSRSSPRLVLHLLHFADGEEGCTEEKEVYCIKKTSNGR
jgi:hypothetical protein